MWRSGGGGRSGSDDGRRRIEECKLGCEADEIGGRGCGSAMQRNEVQQMTTRYNCRSPTLRRAWWRITGDQICP